MIWRVHKAEEQIALLADELDEFLMAVEVYAGRKSQSAEDRLDPAEARRERILFNAARLLRERIAPLIIPQ